MYENSGTATGIRLGAIVPGNYHMNATESAPPPPLGRVAEAEQETRKLVEALGQALQGLENRISPILRSAGPSGVGNAEKAQREPSPFATALLESNQKLYGLIGFVQDLSARVDF